MTALAHAKALIDVGVPAGDVVHLGCSAARAGSLILLALLSCPRRYGEHVRGVSGGIRLVLFSAAISWGTTSRVLLVLAVAIVVAGAPGGALVRDVVGRRAAFVGLLNDAGLLLSVLIFHVTGSCLRGRTVSFIDTGHGRSPDSGGLAPSPGFPFSGVGAKQTDSLGEGAEKALPPITESTRMTH